MTLAMVAWEGRLALSTSAMEVLTTPATIPLKPARNQASEADTLRVRLLSIAQHKQASAISSGPNHVPLTGSADPDQASNVLPATMAAMPSTTRAGALSLNTPQAIKAVKTASRLSSKEAVVPLLWRRPAISATGPSIPPNRIAPSNQGHSPACRPEGFQPRSRIQRSTIKPTPLPRYNKPAIRTGEVVSPSRLANGVLAPNKTAASKACSTAGSSRFSKSPDFMNVQFELRPDQAPDHLG